MARVVGKAEAARAAQMAAVVAALGRAAAEMDLAVMVTVVAAMVGMMAEAAMAEAVMAEAVMAEAAMAEVAMEVAREAATEVEARGAAVAVAQWVASRGMDRLRHICCPAHRLGPCNTSSCR